MITYLHFYNMFIVVWISERCSWPSECTQCACRQWRMYQDQWLWSVVPCTEWAELLPLYQKRIWVGNKSCMEYRFLGALIWPKIPICISGNFLWRMEQHFPRELYSNYGKFLTGNFCSIWFSPRNFWNFQFLNSHRIYCKVWARMHKAYFCLFCEKICHQFRETNAHSDFFFTTKFCKPYQT